MIRAGIGYDIHKLVRGRPLVLGGVTIPFAKGLQGHSDADCLLHAICDALLGAAALGDIGEHFPNTDRAYKNISSVVLLKRTGAILKKNRFVIENIDSVVIAQEPKICKFKEDMRKTISGALGLSLPQVCVKATTPEKIGSLGQGKGIACWATAVIKKGA